MTRRVHVSRETITTAFEIIGAGCITAGVFVLFGAGISLLVGGAFVMGFAYLAGS